MSSQSHADGTTPATPMQAAASRSQTYKMSPSHVLSQYSGERSSSLDSGERTSSSGGLLSSDSANSDTQSLTPILSFVKPAQTRELPGRFYDADHEYLFTLIGA